MSDDNDDGIQQMHGSVYIYIYIEKIYKNIIYLIYVCRYMCSYADDDDDGDDDDDVISITVIITYST